MQALQQEGVTPSAIESILEDCDRDNDRCARVYRRACVGDEHLITALSVSHVCPSQKLLPAAVDAAVTGALTMRSLRASC